MVTAYAPADWRDQVGRWDRLHHGRTALLVLAFAAVSTGLAFLRGQTIPTAAG